MSDDPIAGLRLYEVEITHTIYVLAADQMDAEMEAPGYLRDEGGDPTVYVTAVRDERRLSEDVLKSLPHGPTDEDPPTVEECIRIVAARSAP